MRGLRSAFVFVTLASACAAYACVDTAGLTSKPADEDDGGLDASTSSTLDGSATDASSEGAASDGGSLDLGLLAYYPFDETSGVAVEDKTGRGNTGTLTGDPSLVWKPGKFGNAFHGDGKSTFITLAKRPGGIDLGIGDFTIAAWVMVDAAFADGGQPSGTNRDQQWVVSLASGECCSKSNYPSVRIGWWYGKWSALLGDVLDGGPSDSGNYGHVHGVEDVSPDTPGNWRHITVVRRNGELALFIDGLYREGETLPFLANLDHPSASYLVGRVTNDFFLGAIDELRFYSRGLSDADIGALAKLTP